MGSENKEWKTGYPEKPGWYWCRYEGEEQWLKHFICSLSGRHEWADKRGDYIYTDEVEWSGMPH